MAPGQPPQEFVLVDQQDGTDVTEIERPGQMQWFHVKKDEAGTYLLGLNGPQVKMDVYAPDDLTTPISRYNKATPTIVLADRRMRVDTYVLPREFYIRVSGATRAMTADYLLYIRRSTCASKAEACILQPGQAQSATLVGAANPLGVQNEAWFVFDVVGTSDGGLDQKITLTAGGLPDADNFKATLEDVVNTSGIPAPDVFEDGTRRVFSGPMGDGSTGYLVIRQAAPTAANVPVTAHMDTSLRVLEVLNLTCIDETNPEFGSDDIFTEFTVDGIMTRAPAGGEVEFDCDEPSDEKPWAWAVGQPLIAFVDRIGVKILEDDDVSSNDPSQFELVPSLAADEMVRDGRDHPLEWTFEDGEYRFSYILRKRENLPVK